MHKQIHCKRSCSVCEGLLTNALFPERVSSLCVMYPEHLLWVIEGHAAAEVCVVGLGGLRPSPHQVEQLCPCLLGDEGH